MVKAEATKKGNAKKKPATAKKKERSSKKSRVLIDEVQVQSLRVCLFPASR